MFVEDALKLAFHHQASGNPLAAEQICRQVLQAAPQTADAWHLLALLAQNAQQPAAAVELFQQAIALCPGTAHYHLNLGVALAGMGRDAQAVHCFQQAIVLNPMFAQAHYNLGKARHHQCLAVEAAASYRNAIQIDPGFGEAWCNLAAALHEQGELDPAFDACQRALHSRPAHAPMALYQSELHNNLGNVLRLQGRRAEARECYQRALEFLPESADAHWNLGTLSLMEGKFDVGWPNYEWRWKLPDRAAPRPFAEPLWDGSALHNGTLLVYAEQGFGDTLQGIRYVELVRPRVGRLVVECQAELASLVRRLPEIDQLVVHGEPLPRVDAQVPLMSLPGIFHTSLETIPGRVPYLVADPHRVAHWKQQLEDLPGFRVGIVWQGNPRHRLDRLRSFCVDRLAPLAEVPGVQVYSLQSGSGSDQLAGFARRYPVIDLGARLKDFDDTAAVMQNLDLVVTCDSAPAHLAGALGVPVWMPLQYSPDWRWLLEREDSPWYPTMRMFRQQHFESWTPVFQKMAAELATLVAGRAGVVPQPPG